MVRSQAPTVEEYLAELPHERRGAMEAVRQVILQHLPAGYEETMQFGMIGYVIPLERYPVTYNKLPLGYVALASQKNYVSLYLMGIYGDENEERWFTEEYGATGKRLDKGKSCVRFRKLDDMPLPLIGKAVGRTSVDDFIEQYEASRRGT